MAPYRILSVDGGGIRGLYAAVLLDRLCAAVPALIDRVDLLAGTSTGGILVLGLARGLPPGDLVRLYAEHGHEVFDRSWERDLRDVGGLTGAKYDNIRFKEILTQILGETKLADLGKRVLVPTFDLDNRGEQGQVRLWKPKLFHNFPKPDADGEERAVDVALRTSAAPTYFPVYQHYIDGGLVANNPSMAALAQALDPAGGNQVLADVHLLSLGTGWNPTYIEGENLDWGMGQWARPLVSLMIDGMMGVADFQCARLLGRRYWRLAPMLPRPIALDDVNKTADLIAFARQADLAETLAWIQQNFLTSGSDLAA